MRVIIDRLEGLFGSPHLIDFILGLTALEAVAVVMWRGLSLAAIGRMLLPGVCLLLAVRAALAGSIWPWMPAALAAALVTHLLDLRGRWRS